MRLFRKLIDPKLLLEDLGEEPYIWTETDAEIQEHSDYLRFKEMIERQPIVDAVEVVHGHWKKLTTGGYDFFGSPTIVTLACNCSVCGVDGREETPYCPNCGAKMEGDGDG